MPVNHQPSTIISLHSLTPAQALQKIKHFCAYQERSHAAVKEKLYGYGLNKTEVETILSQLIEENYLNEERFAVQFAGGHFRLKQWGRNKIVYALKQQQVSPYCIRKALQCIDDDDYRAALQKAATQKLKLLKGGTAAVRRTKLTTYLLQKGYESALIREILKEMED
jgi:regulatory protein